MAMSEKALCKLKKFRFSPVKSWETFADTGKVFFFFLQSHDRERDREKEEEEEEEEEKEEETGEAERENPL